MAFPSPTVRTSIPGKLILCGEHAVVYGRPALIAAAGLRLQADFRPIAAAGLRLALPRLKIERDLTWAAVESYAGAARAHWERFAADPAGTAFDAVRGDEPTHVVQVALGEVARAYPEARRLALALHVDSEIPIGRGFGSSSATAVAIIAGLLACLGHSGDVATIERLGLEVERRQHGTPSGVDHRTVLHGGLLWARREGANELVLERREPGAALGDLAVYDTGAPCESTGAVVAAVGRRVRGAPSRYERCLDRIADATRQLGDLLTAARADPPAIVDGIRAAQRGLEELGVVPEPVRGVVREIEARGGAAKISGAGATGGDGAGCLLVYSPGPQPVVAPGLSRCRALTFELGVAGLRVETTA